MTPSPWRFFVLAAASFRLRRLIGEDSILDGPRDRVIDRLGGPGSTADELVRCAWCLGWWTSLGVYAAWRASPRATMTVCVPLAMSAAVGVLSHHVE